MIQVWYHGGCPDGMTAAWAAWKKLGDVYGGQGVEYIPMAYGRELPEFHPGDTIYMVDFCLTAAPLQQVLEKAGKVVILDHHKTSWDELGKVPENPRLNAVFDMNRSGASITFTHFFPNHPEPPIVSYAQDHDLWRFRLPYSKEIRAWLRMFDFTLQDWNDAAHVLDIPETFLMATKTGIALVKFQDNQVDQMARRSRRLVIDGVKVPVVNATCFFSEVGDRLLELHPSAPFVAYYLDRGDGVRQWGLRSRPGTDISDIAKRYGGGGHAQAAGWQEPIALPVEAPRV